MGSKWIGRGGRKGMGRKRGRGKDELDGAAY